MAVNKLEAIYQLREAAERHGKIEAQLDQNPSRDNVYQLLIAKEELEEKTVLALHACEECGQEHCSDPEHGKDNLIPVDFRKGSGD